MEDRGMKDCDVCWGTGFYKGMGAPCSNGCKKPDKKKGLVASADPGIEKSCALPDDFAFYNGDKMSWDDLRQAAKDYAEAIPPGTNIPNARPTGTYGRTAPDVIPKGTAVYGKPRPSQGSQLVLVEVHVKSNKRTHLDVKRGGTVIAAINMEECGTRILLRNGQWQMLMHPADQNSLTSRESTFRARNQSPVADFIEKSIDQTYQLSIACLDHILCQIVEQAVSLAYRVGQL
jgi:hypothetical protein